MTCRAVGLPSPPRQFCLFIGTRHSCPYFNSGQPLPVRADQTPAVLHNNTDTHIPGTDWTYTGVSCRNQATILHPVLGPNVVCRLPQPGPVFGQYPDDAEPTTISKGGGGGVLDSDASVAGVVGDLMWEVLGDGFEEVEAEAGVGGGDVEELYMTQRLDHFNRQESRVFNQRYFVNRR